MNTSLKGLCIAASFLLTLHSSRAQENWTGSADGHSWNVAGNWSGNAVPISTDTVTINIFSTINLPNTSVTIDTLNVTTAGVTLNATTGGFLGNTLNVNNSGTLTLSIAAAGTVEFTNPGISSFVGSPSSFQGGPSTGVLNLTGPGTLEFNTGGDGFGVGFGGSAP